MAIGLGGFVSNIIQFGIDQLIDASATEITSFITWYTMTVYASGVTIHYVADCIVSEKTFYIKTLVVAFCLTLAVCTDFLFKHSLVKDQLITGNSLCMILKVIKYTIRSRNLRNNYGIATEDAIALSRFDVAKHMYGGPFTSQQVDNVRKFLWMLMVIATCAMVFGALAPMDYAREKLEHRLWTWQKTSGIKEDYQYMTLRYSSYFFVIALVILYEFIIHPMFYRCLPKMHTTSKFLLGTGCFFLWILSMLAIEIVVYHQKMMTNNHRNTSFRCIFVEKHDSTNISYKWLLIPSFTSGLSQFFLTCSAFEFIWAQAPSTMKGPILGFGYSFVGLSTLLHTALASPFVFKRIAHHIPWEHAPLTCDIWYFLLEGMIILVILIVISVTVKRYNRQNRMSAYFEPYGDQ